MREPAPLTGWLSSGPHQAEYAVEYSGYAPGAQTLPLMLDIECDP